jgi:beta-glucanase (GH16 family)
MKWQLKVSLAALIGAVPGMASAQSTGAVPHYDHIVVVVEENHGFNQIIGSPDAPFINQLANGGALMTNYSAVSHPSQPNYFALYAGSTFGVGDDNNHSESGPTLATTLQGAGKTFTGFVDSGSPQKHNPWESFPEGTSVEQPMSSFPNGNFSSLPNVSFVIPNLNNDMHDGTVAQADTWLQQNLSAYAQWAKANNSLLVVTADEDDGTGNNQVPTILYGANVKPGTDGTAANHLNLLSTILASNGLAPPNDAASAAPISDAFTTGQTPAPAAASTSSSNNGGTPVKPASALLATSLLASPAVAQSTTPPADPSSTAGQNTLGAALGDGGNTSPPDAGSTPSASTSPSASLGLPASNPTNGNSQQITFNDIKDSAGNDFMIAIIDPPGGGSPVELMLMNGTPFVFSLGGASTAVAGNSQPSQPQPSIPQTNLSAAAPPGDTTSPATTSTNTAATPGGTPPQVPNNAVATPGELAQLAPTNCPGQTFYDNFSQGTGQWSFGGGGSLDGGARPNSQTSNEQAGNNGLTLTVQPNTNGSMMDTQKNFSQTYGYFEANVTIPQSFVDSGAGFDFWMLGYTWPPEIDTVELQGGLLDTAQHSAATSDNSPYYCYNFPSCSFPSSSSDNYTFAVDWEPDKITWYINGQQVDQSSTPSDFNQPMFMVLETDPTGFGAGVTVNSVRAFKDMASAMACVPQAPGTTTQVSNATIGGAPGTQMQPQNNMGAAGVSTPTSGNSGGGSSGSSGSGITPVTDLASAGVGP